MIMRCFSRHVSIEGLEAYKARIPPPPGRASSPSSLLTDIIATHTTNT